MKQLLLTLLLSVQLLAFDTATAAKIFEKILTAMQMQTPIATYTSNSEYQQVIEMAPSLSLVKNPNAADIILVDSFAEIPKDNTKIIFTTNASVFKKNENAVGAFYWEHGRPKIIFLKHRLNAKDITISKSFQRYVTKDLP